MELRTEGGTYMEAGMKAGTELFAELQGANRRYENRLFFLLMLCPIWATPARMDCLASLKLMLPQNSMPPLWVLGRFNAIGRRYYQNSWGQLLFCTFQPRIF